MTLVQYFRRLSLFDRRKDARPSQCLVDATSKHRKQTVAILEQAEELQKLIRNSKVR